MLGLSLIQHPIIADHAGAAEHRRFDATFANSALKRLEGSQLRQRAVVGFGLDQMNEGIVVQPQRNARGGTGTAGNVRRW